MTNQPQFYHRTRIPSRLLSWWFEFQQNKLAFGALLVFATLLGVAVFAPVLAPFDPAQQFDELSLPPSWYDLGDNRYIFGTDDLGRDIFSRLVYGAQLSLRLAFSVVAIASLLGIFLGAITSFARFWLDTVILRVMDLLLALPSLLLAVVIVAIIGPGLPNAIYAVAIVLVPHFALTTRAAIRAELSKEHVMASRLDGAKGARLFLSAILPNILPPLVVQSTLAFSTAILEIASLGFLGLGAQPPNPEWGTILSESHDYILVAPWSVALPGLAIFFTILSINLVGDGLRDAMDVEHG